MATVNKRTATPQASVINGVDAGGTMQASITYGYEDKQQSSPDGLAIPTKDKECQYCRGVIATQDWVHMIELLTGTVGTYIFYERISGVAEANGYVKHTITNPVIHKVKLAFTKKGFAIVTANFECKAADETKGFADMWVPEDAQAAPSYITAVRGGMRIISAIHGSVSILHSLGFELNVELPLAKECNDADIGYTCVDARVDGMTCDGSINFQDTSIATATEVGQKLVAAAKANLVLTVNQSQGATNKTITIANVDFDSVARDANNNSKDGFTESTGNFDVANNPGTPLTLDGDNKIIVIADVV